MASSFVVDTLAPVRTETLASQLPVVAQPAQSNAVTVVEAARRKVAPQRGMLAIAEIVKHDPQLANTLHDRLDFSAVIRGGARLSVEDAYAVLTPHEFARYDAVRQGVSEATFPARAMVIATPLFAGALAAADYGLVQWGAAASRYGDNPGIFGALMLTVVSSMLFAAGVGAAFSTKSSRLQKIAPRIAELKAAATQPRVEADVASKD